MITIKQGEDYTKVFELTYADTNDPVDLTGITAKSEMRDAPGGTLFATASCTVNEEGGTVFVYYSAAQTDEIPTGEYGFDVWLVDNYRKHPIYTTKVTIVGRYTDNF